MSEDMEAAVESAIQADQMRRERDRVAAVFGALIAVFLLVLVKVLRKRAAAS